jgi:hypothetical protein
LGTEISEAVREISEFAAFGVSRTDEIDLLFQRLSPILADDQISSVANETARGLARATQGDRQQHRQVSRSRIVLE